MAVAGLVAVIVDQTVMQFMRSRHASEFALVVATIGVYYLLASIAQERSKSSTEAFPITSFPHGYLHIAGLSLPSLQILSLVISVVVMLLLGYWLTRTRLGRATRSVAYSARTAELLGVNSRAIFALAVFISGCLAAVAGILNAATTSTLSYSDGDQLLAIAFTVIVIGGMGSVRGAVVGGLALGLVQVYTTVYVSGVFSSAITYLLLVVVLIVRPNGLFGVPEETRV
jgi:branched-chain amino acid transport system permease protein